MQRLILVRHGESRGNAQGWIQGQSCAGLSDRGLEQARAVGEALGGAYPEALVVTSDLRRAVETATPVAAILGRAPEQDARLRERSCGAWEGMTDDEVAASDPERSARRRAGEDLYAEVGGESEEMLIARVLPALRELIADTPEGGVTIVVTHGGPVWFGVHELVGLPRGCLGPPGNAAITEVLALQSRFVLGRWNERGHLPGGLRD